MKKIFSYIILSIIPIMFIGSFVRQYFLEKDTMYTIAYTEKSYNSLKSGREITYVYFVKGVKYEWYNSVNIKYDINFPNGKYLVSFSKTHPSICKILWDKPIPGNSMITSPDSGWTNIPKEIK